MADDQEKLLEDAKKAAKEQAYFMRKALENADLRNGLKFASMMLGELRTSQLAPRNYYILFMAIFEYMREIQSYFKEDFRRGRKMADIYEAVQHAPHIIPRLYLLIAAGSVYIQSHEEGSEKILNDLIQMMKSVQNPLRGLFLRYYFLKMCKDRLPDTKSQYETEVYGVEQAIEVIHTNLTESTHLWMRIGGNKDKAKRAKDRNDLKMLIGQNLMRISSLEGVNVKIYKHIVLPKLLNLLKDSKDQMAQQYILDCMIQGFPEQFHIHTLPQFLETCSKELERDVDMKVIFIALMDRLSSYLTDSGNVIENIENGQINVYELFKVNIEELIAKSQLPQVRNTLNLYSAFLQFTIKCYPAKHQYVNEILKEASKYCAKNENSIDDECQNYVSKFLIHPLESLAHIILTIEEYPTLMKYLRFKKRREVAKQITKAVGKGNIELTDEALVKQLLVFILPVLVRQKDYQQISQLLFKDEQTQVAKMVFQINSQDPGTVWEILKMFIDKFLEGGDERIKYTIPSAIFRLFKLAIQISHSEEQPDIKVYKRIFSTVRTLLQKLSTSQPVHTIKLYLQFLSLINLLDKQKFYDEYSYEVATECLLLYESQVSDTALKQYLLVLIINTCMRLNCLSDQNYDTLATNIISYCSKILKKNQQCQILLSCCYLFLNPQADVNRIHEILKRCAKLANASIGQSLVHIGLLLDILSAYFYFTKQKSYIEDRDEAIPQIIELFQSKIQEEPEEAELKLAVQKSKARWEELQKNFR